MLSSILSPPQKCLKIVGFNIQDIGKLILMARFSNLLPAFTIHGFSMILNSKYARFKSLSDFDLKAISVLLNDCNIKIKIYNVSFKIM
jgi:hypothetical protein